MIESVLAAGRAAAESRMTDECVIRRAVGEPAFDPNTGQYADATLETVYSGKCEISAPAPSNPTSRQYGGREITVTMTTIVKLPLSAAVPREGDAVEIIASQTDSGLVGGRFLVLFAQRDARATCRRVLLEEVVS